MIRSRKLIKKLLQRRKRPLKLLMSKKRKKIK